MPAVQTRERPTPTLSKKKVAWLRLNQKYASRFTEAGYTKVAQSLYDCETTELLIACESCGHHFYTLNHCRQRVCVLCSFKVARKRTEFLLAMTNGMKHPKFLTLTMPAWRESPRAGIIYLRKCFNKLRRTALWRSVRGGAYLIELKMNKDFHHIHIHILMDCPFMPYRKLFSAWTKILRVPFAEVHIKAAKDKNSRSYIAKDTTKNQVFYVQPDDIVKWWQATRNLRLFATFGNWFNVTLNKLLDPQGEQETPNVCPNCGQTHSLFFARDGPFIYGHDQWRDVEQAMTGGLDTIRKRPDMPSDWDNNIEGQSTEQASRPDLDLFDESD